MSTTKIYGHPLSIPTRVALATAKQLGVAFEFIPVDLIAGGQHEEEYKKVNPNEKVPLFVEGDFKLSESYAIAKYLSDRGEGTALYPREPKKRAFIDMHIGILNDLKTHQIKIVYLTVLDPKFLKIEADPKKVAASEGIVKKVLGEYEAILSADQDKKFVVGDTFTLIDLILGMQLTGTHWIQWDYGKEFPRLRKYHDDLLAAFPVLQEQLDQFLENLKPLIA
ncbi:hypothetical protein FGO68_gene6807 [Halteria grandinella]|uniref:Glutathione S-transferase n=1 Tax=Halteria grandinella TaxID=5974 RepID=A0A8J8SYM3_HALGN|nr:hypothetical protein FGO68_gene6807 [Halteria grandinella]